MRIIGSPLHIDPIKSVLDITVTPQKLVTEDEEHPNPLTLVRALIIDFLVEDIYPTLFIQDDTYTYTSPVQTPKGVLTQEIEVYGYYTIQITDAIQVASTKKNVIIYVLDSLRDRLDIIDPLKKFPEFAL
jgi:hypothetical protein